mmetsp:Transcript_7341/g.20330  ORF Transcript_7341/g.20330 Transcript_7341/m.20330 type:complete len:205 (+) Transcript_7341:4503-5117(+)
MLGLQGRVGYLLKEIAVVTECVANKDIVVIHVNLRLSMSIDVAGDNGKDLGKRPGHSLTKLIILKEINGGPHLCLLLVMVAGTTRLFIVVVRVKQSAKGRIVAYFTNAAAGDDTNRGGRGELNSTKCVRDVIVLEIFNKVSVIDDIAKARALSRAIVVGLDGFPIESRFFVPPYHFMRWSEVGIARKGQGPTVEIGATVLGAPV